MNKELEIVMEALEKMAVELENVRGDRDWWMKNYLGEQRARGAVEDKLRELVNIPCECDEPDCPCRYGGDEPTSNHIDEQTYEDIVEKTIAKDIGESGEAI